MCYFCDINSTEFLIKQCGIQNFLPTKEEASLEWFKILRRDSASRKPDKSFSLCDHLSCVLFEKFTIYFISTGIAGFTRVTSSLGMIS